MKNHILKRYKPFYIDYFKALKLLEGVSEQEMERYFTNYLFPILQKPKQKLEAEAWYFGELRMKPFIHVSRDCLSDYLKLYGPPNSPLEHPRGETENSLTLDFVLYVESLGLHGLGYRKVLEHFFRHGMHSGAIYSPRQLKNVFNLESEPVLNWHQGRLCMNNVPIRDITLELNARSITHWLKERVHLEVSNADTKKTYDCMVLLYIGNEEYGRLLLNHLQSLQKETFVFVVACHFKVLPIFHDSLQEQLPNLVLFSTEEYGNDIIPSLQAYSQCGAKAKILIKLQSKTKAAAFETLTTYLLSYSLRELQAMLAVKDCVGAPSYTCTMEQDQGYVELDKMRYNSLIDQDKTFVSGTIFCSKTATIDKVLAFLKRKEVNYSSYFLNNTYFCNSILRESPVHFLERLFGLIK